MKYFLQAILNRWWCVSVHVVGHNVHCKAQPPASHGQSRTATTMHKLFNCALLWIIFLLFCFNLSVLLISIAAHSWPKEFQSVHTTGDTSGLGPITTFAVYDHGIPTLPLAFPNAPGDSQIVCAISRSGYNPNDLVVAAACSWDPTFLPTHLDCSDPTACVLNVAPPQVQHQRNLAIAGSFFAWFALVLLTLFAWYIPPRLLRLLERGDGSALDEKRGHVRFDMALTPPLLPPTHASQPSHSSSHPTEMGSLSSSHASTDGPMDTIPLLQSQDS